MKRIKLFIKIIIVSIILNGPTFAGNNFFSEGKVFFDNKKIEKAKFKFEQDIVFNPKNEMSYLYLSKIYKKENNFEKEEINLNTVILLNPQNEEAVYNLITLNISRSDFSSAKNLLKNFSVICKKLCNKKSSVESKLKDSLKR